MISDNQPKLATLLKWRESLNTQKNHISTQNQHQIMIINQLISQFHKQILQFPKHPHQWRSLISLSSLAIHQPSMESTISSMRSISSNPSLILLGLCNNLITLKKVHSLLTVHGLTNEDYLLTLTKLVSSYGSFGSVRSARMVFETIPNPDLYCFKVMLRWYFLNELHYETIMLYNCLRKCLRESDDIVFSNVLKACCMLRYVDKGREVHCHMVKYGSHDDFLLTCLVDVYAKCGVIDAARGVFDEIEDRNVVSWTSLIAGYVQNDCAEEGLRLFNRMRGSLVDGNQFTVGSLVNGCAKLGALHQGKWLHGYIIKAGINVNSFLATSLLDMYVKCRSIKDARSVYDELPNNHDLVCWTAMIVGLSQCGQPNEALKLFVEGKYYKGIVPNSMTIASVLSACAQVGDVKMGRLLHCFATVNGLVDSEVKHALIDMYAKCHLMVESRYIFDSILVRDMFAWNTIISGYTQNGYSLEALKLFRQMTLESMSPDAVTLVSVISACASLSAIRVGSSLHAVVIKQGLSRNNTRVGTALVNFYAKCGHALSARKVFDEIGVKNAVTWSSMIRGYGMQGDDEESFALFNDMLKENVEPTEVTFTAILSACSHSGRVGEGWNYFNSMCREYSFVPSMKHYACMVDILSRAGKLDEALDFIQKMPIEPDFSVLGAFLHGCSLHSRFELGEVVAKRMLEIHPNEACYYVLLCKLYASEGRWDKADEMRSLMKERGLSKSAGWSSGSEMNTCDQLPLLQMSSVG